MQGLFYNLLYKRDEGLEGMWVVFILNLNPRDRGLRNLKLRSSIVKDWIKNRYKQELVQNWRDPESKESTISY